MTFAFETHAFLLTAASRSVDASESADYWRMTGYSYTTPRKGKGRLADNTSRIAALRADER
jgi:hypothetical protein